MRFALLEAKLAIAKALRVVEIQRCEKTEVSQPCVTPLPPILIVPGRLEVPSEKINTNDN